MQPVVEALNSFLDASLPSLDASYQWRLPPTLPYPGYEYGEGSQFAKTLAVRNAVAARWKSHPTERLALANWYVNDWGGIRGNHAATIERYVSTTPEDIIGLGTKGIASWSKVLVIRVPSRFLIYDARVSASLNAIQIIYTGKLSVRFPKLIGQNTKIVKFWKWLSESGVSEDAIKLPPKELYQSYLSLVRDIASRRTDIDHIHVPEMALFALAESLVIDCGYR